MLVNVTSSATMTPTPPAAACTASKIAIEGLTGLLAHELAAFNVQVKLVEPGYGPTTRFTSNGVRAPPPSLTSERAQSESLKLFTSVLLPL